MGKTLSVDAAPILGSWRLISFELRKENGEILLPFGDHAHGTIIYTPAGRFSAQLMRGDRGHPVSEDQMKATPAEAESCFKGCISYFGSYTFDPMRGIVLHHVEGSLFPNWEGLSLKRFYRLSGDRLELSTPPTVWGGGGMIVGVIQWERLSDGITNQ